MSCPFFFLLTSGINNNGSYGSFISPQNLIVWRVALLSLCQVWILKLNNNYYYNYYNYNYYNNYCYSSSCSVIVRVSVVLKRTVGKQWLTFRQPERSSSSESLWYCAVSGHKYHHPLTAQYTPGFKPFTINCYSLFMSWLVLFFTKWKGAGGLKRCFKTSEDDAKANMQIADGIVDNAALNRWYGTYPIGNHGVFVMNRSKAKMLLARKLSQERKPSAYKRKVHDLFDTFTS